MSQSDYQRNRQLAVTLRPETKVRLRELAHELGMRPGGLGGLLLDESIAGLRLPPTSRPSFVSTERALSFRRFPLELPDEFSAANPKSHFQDRSTEGS